MALWSMFVEIEDVRYSAQVTANDVRRAIRGYLKTDGLKECLGKLFSKGWPASFSMKDLVLFIPMEGLVNVHLCQIGREGKYASVVMARTVSRKHAYVYVDPPGFESDSDLSDWVQG